MNPALAVIIAALVAVPAPVALAADGAPTHHVAASPANSPNAMTQGVVKRVDKAADSVTIAHEALTHLGMPAMTMSFQVKDRAWLDAMKIGAPIRFRAESVHGELTVVALEPSK